MEKRVTIKDIAAKTGTSVASVHRALYGSKGVSKELRERILKEVENSNYQMDEAASMLRRKEYNITILLPKARGEERFYYRGLWDGIYKGVQDIKRNKVKINFIKTTKGINHLHEALEQLFDETDESLNGLVTICDDQESKDWIQRFIRRGTQVALVDRGVEIENLCCCMESSAKDMGCLMVHMMRFIVRKDTNEPIIFVNGSEHRVSYQIYLKAIQEAIKTMKLNYDLIVINGAEEAVGRKQLKKLLGEQKISCIATSCARATYWVCDEISKMKEDKKPPIIGTDVFEELIPFFEDGILTASIYQSHKEYGEKAVKQLYESLLNPHLQIQPKQLGSLSIVLKENYKYFI